MMRDDRRVPIQQEDPRANDGFGKFAAWMFWSIMTIALIDRGLTIAWEGLSGVWVSFLSQVGLG